METAAVSQQVKVALAPGAALEGDLQVPANAAGLVIFAHGSGSSRHSPRNRSVADVLHQARLGTLLLDLLTPDEAAADALSGDLRFDIGMLASRVQSAVDWAVHEPRLRHLRICLFGASTGAAAALVAAANRPEAVRAVVSRGGRPDLAMAWLGQVRCPTLLLVGDQDHPVVGLNQEALARLSGEKELLLVPGATHLFEERGALERVASSAADWFRRALAAPA